MAALLEEDRQLFLDGLTKLLRDQYEFSMRKKYKASPEGWSREMWSHYASIGLLGLGIDEEFGGSGGSVTDIASAMQAIGGVLALEPIMDTAFIGGQAVQLLGSQSQKEALLPKIVQGELVLSFAHAEAETHRDCRRVNASARLVAGGWELTGSKICVRHAASANKFLVTANSIGGAESQLCPALFLVDSGAAGLHLSKYEMQDGMPAASVTLESVSAEPLGATHGDLKCFQRLLDIGAVNACASSVGAMSSVLDQTIAYIKTRQLFGKVIADFQAARHRIADMYIAKEKSVGITLAAIRALENDDSGEIAKTVSAAKVLVSQNGWFVTEQAIQLHGGIGMTEDCAVGHFMRSHMVNDQLFGDPMQHLESLAAMEKDTGCGVDVDMRERARF